MPPLTRVLATLAAAAGLWSCGQAGASQGAPPLTLERTIALPKVAGRIDHLALDPAHQRLFVAELGNGTVEAVDLKSGRSLGRIAGLSEPQGLAYLAGRDELAVASGGDGSVRFYRAADLLPAGSLKLGDDPDNVRVDPADGRVVVGYGKTLAVIDPASRKVVTTIPLPAHPEGFQLVGGKAVINVPDAGGIAVVDLVSGRVAHLWPNPGWKFNFPMAVEADQAAVVYRLPARLGLFDLKTGAVTKKLPTCGDSDDAFFDTPRRRLYVVCGSGAVEVFERRGKDFVSLGRVATSQGARTGLWDAAGGRLYVAARATGGRDAAIMVLAPKD